MALDTTERTQSNQTTRVGTIIAIAYSKNMADGIRKEMHPSANVEQWGIPGDRHYGETRYSRTQRKVVQNERPITIIATEAIRDACEAIGIPSDTVPYGGMGENFLTEGLGDLSDAEAGDILQILDESGNPKITFRIEGQNPPCSNLKIYHKLMTKNMMHKRGLLCTVLQAGSAEVGDKVAFIKS